MTAEYEYDSENNIVRTQVSGTITVPTMQEYVRSIVQDKRIRNGFIECMDFQNVEDFVIAYKDVSILSRLWHHYIQKECKATIVAAPTDLAYGCCRMIQKVIELDHEDTAPEFIVVRSQEELRLTVDQISAG